MYKPPMEQHVYYRNVGQCGVTHTLYSACVKQMKASYKVPREFSLTCFARYLLSWLWLFSICLEIAPRDVRLNSRFSILSFVVIIGISDDVSAAGKGFNIPSILRDGNHKTHHSLGCPGCTQHSEHVPVSIKNPVHMWVNEEHFRVIRLYLSRGSRSLCSKLTSKRRLVRGFLH